MENYVVVGRNVFCIFIDKETSLFGFRLVDGMGIEHQRVGFRSYASAVDAAYYFSPQGK